MCWQSKLSVRKTLMNWADENWKFDQSLKIVQRFCKQSGIANKTNHLHQYFSYLRSFHQNIMEINLMAIRPSKEIFFQGMAFQGFFSKEFFFQGIFLQRIFLQGIFFPRNSFSKEIFSRECYFQGMSFPRNFLKFLLAFVSHKNIIFIDSNSFQLICDWYFGKGKSYFT